jgi:hypothetical protein
VGLKSFLLRFQLPKFVFGLLQRNIIFLSVLDKLGLYNLDDRAEKALIEGTQSLSDDKNYYDFTYEILRKFKGRVNADGSDFAVVAVAGEDDWRKEDSWAENRDALALDVFLKEETFSYFNPSPGLSRARAGFGECLTFGCGGHLNEKGHDVMAELIFGYLKDNFLKK